MSLCPSCKSVSIPNLLSELEKVPVWWEDFCGSSDPRGMVHLDDARKLSNSAATGCPLCCLIVDVVLQKLYQPMPITTTITPARPKQSRGQRYDPLLRGELIDEPIYLRPQALFSRGWCGRRMASSGLPGWPHQTIRDTRSSDSVCLPPSLAELRTA
jgi:hypothetical protein